VWGPEIGIRNTSINPQKDCDGTRDGKGSICVFHGLIELSSVDHWWNLGSTGVCFSRLVYQKKHWFPCKKRPRSWMIWGPPCYRQQIWIRSFIYVYFLSVMVYLLKLMWGSVWSRLLLGMIQTCSCCHTRNWVWIKLVEPRKCAKCGSSESSGILICNGNPTSSRTINSCQASPGVDWGHVPYPLHFQLEWARCWFQICKSRRGVRCTYIILYIPWIQCLQHWEQDLYDHLHAAGGFSRDDDVMIWLRDELLEMSQAAVIVWKSGRLRQILESHKTGQCNFTGKQQVGSPASRKWIMAIFPCFAPSARSWNTVFIDPGRISCTIWRDRRDGSTRILPSLTSSFFASKFLPTSASWNDWWRVRQDFGASRIHLDSYE